MIKLSRLADYAVVLLSQMTFAPGAVHNTADLSARTGIPGPTVSKLLAMLTRGGIVRSVRGARGGYTLAQDADSISAAAIIIAIDGPIALTQCAEEEGSCTVESLCPTRGGWHRVNQVIREALASVSLAELVVPPPSAPPPGASTAVLPASRNELPMMKVRS